VGGGSCITFWKLGVLFVSLEPWQIRAEGTFKAFSSRLKGESLDKFSCVER